MTIFQISKNSQRLKDLEIRNNQRIKDLETRISFIEGEIKVLRNDTSYHKDFIKEMKQDIKDIKTILISMKGK